MKILESLVVVILFIFAISALLMFSDDPTVRSVVSGYEIPSVFSFLIAFGVIICLIVERIELWLKHKKGEQ